MVRGHLPSPQITPLEELDLRSDEEVCSASQGPRRSLVHARCFANNLKPACQALPLSFEEFEVVPGSSLQLRIIASSRKKQSAAYPKSALSPGRLAPHREIEACGRGIFEPYLWPLS